MGEKKSIWWTSKHDYGFADTAGNTVKAYPGRRDQGKTVGVFLN